MLKPRNKLISKNTEFNFQKHKTTVYIFVIDPPVWYYGVPKKISCHQP